MPHAVGMSTAALLLTADVAQLWRELTGESVTPATIRSWARSGRLKAAQTASGVRLFERADVEALAASRTEAVA